MIAPNHTTIQTTQENSIMRITQAQLRRIIREERARLREEFDPEQLRGMGAGGAAMQTAINEIRGEWMMIGEADPDMAMRPGGYAGWEQQVNEAISSLTEQIMNTVNEVEDGLINGDFAIRVRV